MMLRRLYRLLLILYPPNFRAKYGEEQATVFDDMWQQTLREKSLFGAGWFAINAFIDLFRTAVLASDDRPGAIERVSSLAALFLLMPATIFATINITKYNLDIPQLYDWWAITGIRFSDVVILSSPLLAMTVLLLPLIQVNIGGGLILQRSNQKLSRLSTVIAVGSILVMSIFMVYGIAENVLPRL